MFADEEAKLLGIEKILSLFFYSHIAGNQMMFVILWNSK